MGCSLSKLRPPSPTLHSPPVTPSQPPFQPPPVQLLPPEQPPPPPVKPPQVPFQPLPVQPPPPGPTPPPALGLTVEPPPPAQVLPVEPPPAPPSPPVNLFNRRKLRRRHSEMQNCISLFETINKENDVEYLVRLIDKLLQSFLNGSKEEKTLMSSTSSETFSNTLKDNSVWTSFLRSGSVFLKFVNKHIQLKEGDERNRRAVAQILRSVEKMHWAVAGLSVVVFLLDQIDQISENRNECIELLRQMFKLAGHIRKLNYEMPLEDKTLSEAIILIVEGSMMCASQLKSRTLFRFLEAFVDSRSLDALKEKISLLPMLPPPPPTVKDCISLFESINNVGDVNYLIDFMDELLQSLVKRTKEEKTLKRSTSSETFFDTLKGRRNSVWFSFLLSGSVFLEFVNKHIQPEKGDTGYRRAIAQILQKVHWAVVGLSVVAFLLDQIGQISENRSECIELLIQMFKLAGHIRNLTYDMPQEDQILTDAALLIVEGSMMCASQLKSRTLFRFLKASTNSETLGTLQLKINQLYQNITLIVVKKIQHAHPVTFSPWKPIYPDYAVGIQNQKKQVMELLDMEIGNKSLAVVIYGFGGIGKTTLATAVIAELDLTDYNYSGVQIQEDRSRNDIKCMQQQILKDAFPAYTYDRNVTLRNSSEGRDHLTSAFKGQGNKPVFLFIDNALRAEDLQELFPKRLAGLPKRSRIVVTTRNLGVTDMLKDAGLARREHCVGTLPGQEAIKILLRDSNPDNTRDRDKLQKTLQICAGIPLVLEIVGARLRKQNYMVERCTQIFEALETGQDIKEENLSRRLVTFVYNDLEASMREAFLDICCFFANWNQSDVECIVGAEEVTHLEEAALIKTSDKGKIIVHDIIRAKGLNMCESTRIIDMHSWLDVCDNQRLDQIKGVWLSRQESEPEYELDELHIFSMKKSLRVLALDKQVNVLRSSQKTPKFKELRFLRLGGDTSGLWPANLESLERLAVFHGPVFKDGVTLYQLPKRLRVMKATAQSQESANSHESTPTKVIQNSSLEELDLKELKSLQRLPQRLDHLTALKVLILDEWDKMQELPEQVCRLRSLCKLSICGGSSLKNLPESFGQLSCLEELILTSCTQLEELPSTFGELRSLKHLNLAGCVNLKELPSSFGRLSSLEVLNLERCWKLEALPSSFGELSSLAELRCNCLELKELPASFWQLSSLTHLDLSCCINLRTLPSSVGELRSLKNFNLLACFKLEELPSEIGELPCLTQLDLSGCNSLRECPKFSGSRQRNQKLTIRLPDHLRDRAESSSNQMSRSFKH